MALLRENRDPEGIPISVARYGCTFVPLFIHFPKGARETGKSTIFKQLNLIIDGDSCKLFFHNRPVLFLPFGSNSSGKRQSNVVQETYRHQGSTHYEES